MTERAFAAPRPPTRCCKRRLKFNLTSSHFEGKPMSSPSPQHVQDTNEHPIDPVEAIVPAIPVVLPIVGGVLIFLLAFIAVSMA